MVLEKGEGITCAPPPPLDCLRRIRASTGWWAVNPGQKLTSSGADTVQFTLAQASTALKPPPLTHMRDPSLNMAQNHDSHGLARHPGEQGARFSVGDQAESDKLAVCPLSKNFDPPLIKKL